MEDSGRDLYEILGETQERGGGGFEGGVGNPGETRPINARKKFAEKYSNLWAILQKFDNYPKGPFHTKNAIAMEIVVFATAVVFFLSVPGGCEITRAVVNYYRGSELLSG